VRRRTGGGALIAVLAAVVLACPTSAAAADDLLFGFSDGSPVFPYEGSATAEELAALESAAGAAAGRFTIRWEDVQPTPSPPVGPPLYDFSRVDPLVQALAGQGIDPLPMVLGAPGWARERGCSGVCPPAPSHAGDWRTFVRAVLHRYPKSVAIEIWNEPNLDAYWARPQGAEPGPDPAAYARLFGEALEATKTLAPDTPMLLGGLAFAAAEGVATGMPVAEWLRGFYGAAPSAGVDLADPRFAVAVHVYPGVDEVERLLPNGRFAETMAAARGAIAAGDPDPVGREIWITEFGASSTAPLPPALAADPLGRQASVIVAGLEAFAAADDVVAAFVYTAVDRPVATESGRASEEGFGLVTRGPELSPKPAYCAVAAWREAPAPEGC
jgi:hypothetical protein